MQTLISQITRCSLHDGPGIRSVVYLKGCNLRCQWCQNPESQSARIELLHRPDRCIQCGRCLSVCPHDCRTLSDGQIVWHREQCQNCCQCATVCPNEAIAICGQRFSEQEVFAQVRKDRHYYASTGGGVTFSGGECLLQPHFVRAVADLCQKDDMHTAVESAFCVPWSSIATVMDAIDLFFADIKHPDDATHRRLTGQGNRLILDNIGRLSAVHQAIIIRIPLIPGVNDDPESLTAIADIINSFGRGIRSVELLRYNNLAEGKYRALGRPYHSFAEHPQDDQTIEACAAILRSRLRDGLPVLF